MSAPQNLLPEHLYAQSALLIDMDTGETLFTKNARVRMYPASTTKIMTLLLGLESGIVLDEKVTIPRRGGRYARRQLRDPRQARGVMTSLARPAVRLHALLRQRRRERHGRAGGRKHRCFRGTHERPRGRIGPARAPTTSMPTAITTRTTTPRPRTWRSFPARPCRTIPCSGTMVAAPTWNMTVTGRQTGPARDRFPQYFAPKGPKVLLSGLHRHQDRPPQAGGLVLRRFCRARRDEADLRGAELRAGDVQVVRRGAPVRIRLHPL